MIFRVACLAAITIPVIAQTAAFEAVSIKPAAPDGHGETRRYPGGRFTATGITVKALIQRAWDVKDFQITGGPELDQMIQSMLRDRFRLEIHRETKDMPIYSLMVAKSGPKLTPTTATMQTWSRGNGSLVGTNGTSAGIDPWTSRNAGD